MNKVQYAGSGADTARGPSGSIWGLMPLSEIREDAGRGQFFFDDFTHFSVNNLTQTTSVTTGGYKVFASSGGSVAPTAQFGSTETVGGIIGLTVDTNNEQACIGMAACPFGMLSTSKKLVWEARIATTQIVTNDAQLFVGLGENDALTFGASVPLADGNATDANGALIGFNRLEDGLGVLNASYADRAASWTNVKASIGSIAALTWVKVGMVFDPTDLTNTIKFYVNGVPSTTVVSQSTLSGLTYLDAGTLGLCASIFSDSAGTSSYLYIDWWGAAQEF